jgi:hypothetical protein
MSNFIKRIHVEIGKKKTTVSMDEALFNILEQRLPDNILSVRQWVQAQIKLMIANKTLSENERSSSVSRRLQANAIRLIAYPACDRCNQGSNSAPSEQPE